MITITPHRKGWAVTVDKHKATGFKTREDAVAFAQKLVADFKDHGIDEPDDDAQLRNVEHVRP
jgi:hypothetical protein